MYFIMFVAVLSGVTRKQALRLRLVCRKSVRRALYQRRDGSRTEPREKLDRDALTWEPFADPQGALEPEEPFRVVQNWGKEAEPCIPIIDHHWATHITGQKGDVNCPQRWVILGQGSFLYVKTIFCCEQPWVNTPGTWENKCYGHAQRYSNTPQSHWVPLF